MQKVETKFGVIYIEDFHHRAENERLKIYDSNQRYLDYWSVEIIEDIAQTRKTTAEQVIQDEIEELKSEDDIEYFIMMIAPDWQMYTDDIDDVLDDFFTSDINEVLNNDFVNQIGSYYIVMKE